MPSAVIRRFEYQPDKNVLDVIFTTGRRYRYRDVPPKIFQEMRSAFSKGAYFNRHIRHHFAFERMG